MLKDGQKYMPLKDFTKLPVEGKKKPDGCMNAERTSQSIVNEEKT